MSLGTLRFRKASVKIVNVSLHLVSVALPRVSHQTSFVTSDTVNTKMNMLDLCSLIA